jgi:hypothetical protein
VIHRQSTPLDGRVISRERGDETIARYTEVDLDADPPRVKRSSPDVTTWGAGLAATPLRFPYNVTDKDNGSMQPVSGTDDDGR